MSQSTQARRARELRRKGEIRQNTWIRLPHGTIMNPDAAIWIYGKSNRSDFSNVRALRKKLRRERQNEIDMAVLFRGGSLMGDKPTIDDFDLDEDSSGFYPDSEFNPDFFFRTGNSEFDEWYYEFVVKQRKEHNVKKKQSVN